MRFSLASYLESVMGEITQAEEENKSMNEELLGIIEKNPAQVVLIGLQTLWSKKVEDALINGGMDHLKSV